ncbi:hypothetical protein BJX99DRAFT_261618 [Aspergillus californicus]
MADVLWQYNLFYRGWGTRLIEKLGGHPVHSSQLLDPAAISGLQPYYVLVSLLALGNSFKQIVHIVFVSEQAMGVGSGIAVACFNTVFNTVNTLLSLWTFTSSAASVPKSNSLLDTLSVPLIAVGVGAYSLGLLLEGISEFQRKTFKQDPKNQGKPYSGGLFSLATNINYGACTIWRTGYAFDLRWRCLRCNDLHLLLSRFRLSWRPCVGSVHERENVLLCSLQYDPAEAHFGKMKRGP